MNRMIKDTLILFAITLVAGFGLGAVYNITKEAREAQEEKTKIAAYKDVMPEMTDYETIKDLNIDNVNKHIAESIKTTENDYNISPIKPLNVCVDEVVLAKDNSGNEIGYIVTVTDKEAYDGSLQMTVGILKDKTVKGISFLSLTETPGLGMRANDSAFKNQFQDKKVDFFVYNKSGKSNDNEIDAISSATITTNAVTHGVNAAINCVDYLTGGTNGDSLSKEILSEMTGGDSNE